MATDDMDDMNEKADEQEREYIRGGRGRKDEVIGSGPDAVADEDVRSEGYLIGQRRGRRRMNDDLDFDDDDSWGWE